MIEATAGVEPGPPRVFTGGPGYTPASDGPGATAPSKALSGGPGYTPAGVGGGAEIGGGEPGVDRADGGEDQGEVGGGVGGMNAAFCYSAPAR